MPASLKLVRMMADTIRLRRDHEQGGQAQQAELQQCVNAVQTVEATARQTTDGATGGFGHVMPADRFTAAGVTQITLC